MERGRIVDSINVFNEIQDTLKKGHPFIYNIALAEYLSTNPEKCMIILESPKSS